MFINDEHENEIFFKITGRSYFGLSSDEKLFYETKYDGSFQNFLQDVRDIAQENMRFEQDTELDSLFNIFSSYSVTPQKSLSNVVQPRIEDIIKDCGLDNPDILDDLDDD